MTNHDSDGLFEGDGEDSRELSWTEADWQEYLAEHDEAVQDYLKHYDQLAEQPDRIDEVARRMGWEMTDVVEDSVEELAEEAEGFEADWEPYTLHRNPVYIATKALSVSLIANWERIAAQPGLIGSAQAITLLGSLYRAREQAMQAVQALDLGDYTLAVCFFKRALRELNETLARLDDAPSTDAKLLARYRDYALPRLFDLREIWLRVMNECRQQVDDGAEKE
jgi:hypothetical protein